MKFTYHLFICTGHVDEMRKTFNAIRGWAASNRPEWLACPLPGAQPAVCSVYACGLPHVACEGGARIQVAYR